MKPTLRASRMTPTRDWLMTLVGPPDWPMTALPLMGVAMVYASDLAWIFRNLPGKDGTSRNERDNSPPGRPIKGPAGGCGGRHSEGRFPPAVLARARLPRTVPGPSPP